MCGGEGVEDGAINLDVHTGEISECVGVEIAECAGVEIAEWFLKDPAYPTHYPGFKSGLLKKAPAHTAYPTHYLSFKSGLLKKVSAHTDSKVIGYALLWPICDLGDRWFGLGVVVYIGCFFWPPNYPTRGPACKRAKNTRYQAAGQKM